MDIDRIDYVNRLRKENNMAKIQYAKNRVRYELQEQQINQAVSLVQRFIEREMSVLFWGNK